MDEKPINRFAIERAQTVTLADDTKIRFRWVDFDLVGEWRQLRDSENDNRQYVVCLILALSHDGGESEQHFYAWPDVKILELVEKYLKKFGGDGEQRTPFATFLHAGNSLDEYLDRKEKELSASTERAIASFSKWFNSAAIAPQLVREDKIRASMRNFTSLSQQMMHSPIIEMQQRSWKDFEKLSQGISSSLLQYSKVSEQMMESINRITDWTSSFRINYENLFSAFQSSLSWTVPEYLENIFAQHRADFLLEEGLHFLLDATDSGIDDFAKQLYRRSIDARPTEVTKYLHRATSSDDFISDLLGTISSNPKIKGRRRIIEAAISAHKDRHYLLSIPALLPQVEALTMHLLAKLRYVKWDRARMCWFEIEPNSGAHRLDKNNSPIAVHGLGSLDGVIRRITDNPIPEGLPFIKEEVARYRNNVLHGKLVSYDQPRKSSSLVLLVLLLVNILGMNDEP